MRVLMPLPTRGFDPTETGAPWHVLTDAGVEVIFATPDGDAGPTPEADPLMLRANVLKLGPAAPILIADARGRAAYRRMAQSTQFRPRQAYAHIDPQAFDGLVLPGGHAPDMKAEYLESGALQEKVARFFALGKPIGAICHGVLLASRCTLDGRSVLADYRTTALTERMELLAWKLTDCFIGRPYYRTYDETLEHEVRRAVREFDTGPQLPVGLALSDDADRADVLARLADGTFMDALRTGFLRDGPGNRPQDEAPAFVHVDPAHPHYISARWPGDAFTFGRRFLELLQARRG